MTEPAPGAEPGPVGPADPFEDGDEQASTLLAAVERRDLARVRLLVEQGAGPDDDAFYHACEQSDPAYLDALYHPGFEDMVLHKLDFEDAVGLRWFLDHGVDVNARGCLPWAIGRGRGVEILRLLLDAGADVNLAHPQLPVRPLEAAARAGHLAAYDLLVAHGATADLDPVAVASLAVARGESTELPTGPAPMPGVTGDTGDWLLGQLALHGRTEIVRSLLDAGADVDARGWSNFTPLDAAAMHGRTETVQLLIDRGAALDDGAFEDSWPTPLDCAIWGARENRTADGDYPATVRALMAVGAPTGHTPPTGDAEIDRLLSSYHPARE